jgi:hypothetical protein
MLRSLRICSRLFCQWKEDGQETLYRYNIRSFISFVYLFFNLVIHVFVNILSFLTLILGLHGVESVPQRLPLREPRFTKSAPKEQR